ncbi:transcriptional repressor [Comamonas sp.]|uniref:Fur family transcriptional regulator n=1 Tax=Comamonas sp. TaxID=34028 RepID=UPI0028972ACF|nr:transcriptional repressor [Comamonas sp.]
MAHQHHITDTVTTSSIETRLRNAGIQPTRQRVAIAQVLLHAPVHLAADDILLHARHHLPSLSRATVYNTLPLFVEKGLLRALRLDQERTVYDSRTDAHSHIYHEDTGMLEDIPSDMLQWPSVPKINADLELVGLDLIVRVRQRQRPAQNPRD